MDISFFLKFFLFLSINASCLACISHKISDDDKQNVLSDLSRVCQKNKTKVALFKDDETDCSDSPRGCEKYGLDGMSIEEKVGQLLMVHFHGDIANDESRQLIEQAKVGSFIYYGWANDLTDPIKVQRLSNSLQQQSKDIPLLIAVDQEGGAVNRLQSGFTNFPGNIAVTNTQNPAYAKKIAYAIGEELKATGINMNLAPVIDVNVNPLNPVIGVRSFGKCAELVTEYSKKALEGYNKVGIIASMKHFPGHGDVSEDSHIALPVINKSYEELEKVELAPFRDLKEISPCIMAAHLFVPAFDSENCATLSNAIITGLLKEKLGYHGVVIADSVVMKGFLDQEPTIFDACIKALKAGCDLLILGGKNLITSDGFELPSKDMLAIHEAIVSAVNDGRLSINRLNESCQKILDLKKKYGLYERRAPTKEDIYKCVKTPSHENLAKEVAKKSCEKICDLSKKISLHDKKVGIIGPYELQNVINQTTICDLGAQSKIFFYENHANEEVLKIGKWADVLVVMTSNAWKNTDQRQLIFKFCGLSNKISDEGETACLDSPTDCKKTIVLIALRDAKDLEYIKEADVVYTTLSPDPYSLQLIVDILN